MTIKSLNFQFVSHRYWQIENFDFSLIDVENTFEKIIFIEYSRKMRIFIRIVEYSIFVNVISSTTHIFFMNIMSFVFEQK